MRLTVQCCSQCRHLYIHPRNICKDCGGTDFEEVSLSGKGHIYSYTVIYEPPEGCLDLTPYTIVVVELECEQPMFRIIARLSSNEDIDPKIGAPVVLEKVVDSGYYFTLLP